VAWASGREYHVAMDLGMQEMLFILLLALLIFGPRKLPEIGRGIGRAIAEFKRASNQFKYQIEDEMRQLESEERERAERAREERQIAPPEGTVPASSAAAESMPATVTGDASSAQHGVEGA
jgi:sec-independent protein translocase protein TatB